MNAHRLELGCKADGNGRGNGWGRLGQKEAPLAHEDKPTGLGSHLKVKLVFCPDNSGHGMEFAMAPLDSAAESPAESATALQDTLTLLDQKLRGERLAVDSADKKWPLGRSMLFILVASFVLWTGIYFTVSSVF
jgi:hypothetical protein